MVASGYEPTREAAIAARLELAPHGPLRACSPAASYYRLTPPLPRLQCSPGALRGTRQCAAGEHCFALTLAFGGVFARLAMYAIATPACAVTMSLDFDIELFSPANLGRLLRTELSDS